jgi:hypothetical protein
LEVSNNKLKIGKTWVAAALMSHAKKAGAIVAVPQFTLSENDRNLLNLSFQVAGKTYQESFQSKDLEDCVSDPEVRTRLTQKIRRLVKDL